ncbi:MAG: acyltransferase [Acidimicrobiia bacterium]|nr:acyltransferase [Acidimicrobiia bacterium]MBP8180668.1 acyltransferase [Acidimicrobiia bacterium]
MYVNNDTSTTRRPHIPALDGLRALAVSAVLAFHNGFDWIRGGFLGVSLFFTLSGLLITSVLLSAWASGGLGLDRFWVRRIRRLTPALLVTVAGSVLAFWAVGDETQLATLRGDIPWTLTYTANWEHVIHSTSYLDLFIAPSALLHTWSLAIEEQMYLIVPFLVWVCLGKAAPNDPEERYRRVKRLALAFAVLIAASQVASALSAAHSIDLAYYGTHTRAFELLAGALLATVIFLRRIGGASVPSAALGQLVGVPDMSARGTALGARRSGTVDGRRGDAGELPAQTRAERRRLQHDSRISAPLTAAGAFSLALIVVLWTTASQDDRWLYPYGLMLHAAATLVLLIVASGPGPLAVGLSARPLRAIGRWSYGIYLYHWPVFIWLDPGRAHLDGVPLFVVRCAVTTALAAVSYRFLEEPVRTGALPKPSRARPALVGAVAATVLIAAVFTGGAIEPATNLVSQPLDLADATAPPDGVVGAPGRVVTEGPSLTTLAGGTVPISESAAEGAGAGSARGPEPTQASGLADPTDPSGTANQGGQSGQARSAWIGGTAGMVGDDLVSQLTKYGDLADRSKLPRPFRIMVFGDSVAESLGHGLTDWAEAENATAGTQITVWNIAIPECSFARETVRPRIYVTERGHTCNYWADYLPDHLSDFQPDVVVLLSGQLDRQRVKLPQWDRELGPGDQVYDDWLLSEYTAISELMLSSGAHVFWLTSPCRDNSFITPSGLVIKPDDGPLEPINDGVVPQLAKDLDSDRFRLVDFDAVVCPDGGFTNRVGPVPEGRPDGLHFTTASADWLGELIGPVLEQGFLSGR